MTQLSRRRFVNHAALLAGSATLWPLPGASTLAAGDSGTLGFRSAMELAALLRSKAISSVELTRYFIERIERFDKTLNAVPVRDFQRAMEAARAADSALARETPVGPLHGLPMTIKESYDIAGLPTTWGVPERKDHVPAEDAVVVRRLKAAGAHFLGKTNVPLMLGDFQSYNDIYGTTGNPWNPELTPGGSSGGGAAALAAGLTGLESGSDIGGSIRNPAHFCGVFGHKPTWGIVPQRGQQPPGLVSETDLSVVGPMARSAEDLAMALDILAGADVLTAPGWRLELPAPRMNSLGDLRVALWPDDPRMPVDREVADRVAEVGRILQRHGARVSDSARPDFNVAEAYETYQSLLLSIVGGPDDDIPHRTWMRLDNTRTRYRFACQAFFQDWDVLVCPIMPTTAFPHDHRPYDKRSVQVNGEAYPYFNQLFWAGLAILCYLPSTVFPAGLSQAGLPIGLQVMGGEFHDRTAIEFARLMARELGGFTPPPGYAD